MANPIDLSNREALLQSATTSLSSKVCVSSLWLSKRGREWFQHRHSENILQSEDKICVLALFPYCNDMYSACREEYKPHCFVLHVLALHIVLTLNVLMLKLCLLWYTCAHIFTHHLYWFPCFECRVECVDAKIVLALILYLCTHFHTPFILVSSLRMPVHVGVFVCGGVCVYVGWREWLKQCEEILTRMTNPIHLSNRGSTS